MSDYYPQFLASMSGVVANYPNVPTQPQQDPQQQQQQQQQQPQQQQQQQQQHHPPTPGHDALPLALPLHLQQQQQPAGVLGLGLGPGNSYQSLGLYTGFPEPVLFQTPKAQRHRRKSAPGADHVKHRRTRSGCYTCRSRRIKCDEGRPTCERCKKGKRECVYPDPPSSKQSSTAGGGGRSSQGTSTPSQQESPESSNGEDNDEDELEHDAKLDTIPDYDETVEPDDLETEEGPSQQQQQQQQQLAVSFNERVLKPPLRQSSTTSLLGLKRAGASSTGIATATASGAGTGKARGSRQASETPSLDGKSSSPSTSTGTAGSSLFPTTSYYSVSVSAGAEPSPASAAAATADASHLPQDLRFFLGFFADHITHYHYCMPTDPENFMRDVLPGLALRYEPLLYAVVAFSAYHYILRDPAARMQLFLLYYDRSVKLLLGILQRKEAHNVGTLLTILQLATIEEYLGDWVNLMGHQRAALEILTDVFTPETAMQTSTSRMILQWYSRFDVFVGLMGGFETALARAWFTSPIVYYEARAASESDGLVWQIEACSARLRQISMEMSLLFARPKGRGGANDDDDDDDDDLGKSGSVGGGSGAFSSGGDGLAGFPAYRPDEAFVREHARLLDALHAWKRKLDALVRAAAGPGSSSGGAQDDDDNPAQRRSLLVTEFPQAQPLGEDDIVDPYSPSVLYHEPLFAVTIMTCEWQSIVVMHEMQAAQLAMAAQGGGGGGGGGGVAAMASGPPTMNAPGSLPTSTTAAAAAAAAAAATAGGPATPDSMPLGMARLAERAYAICQIFETLERWPESPPGSLIITQAMLAIAALFLPRDRRHQTWIRRKFALIESMGYIFPLTMRTRMAELLQDPACARWWLPHDEGFSPILRSVRAFADERNVTAVSAQTENLREIRHIFAKMQLGGGGSAEDAGDTGQPAGSQGPQTPVDAGTAQQATAKGKPGGVRGRRSSNNLAKQTKRDKGKGVMR